MRITVWHNDYERRFNQKCFLSLERNFLDFSIKEMVRFRNFILSELATCKSEDKPTMVVDECSPEAAHAIYEFLADKINVELFQFKREGEKND